MGMTNEGEPTFTSPWHKGPITQAEGQQMLKPGYSGHFKLTRQVLAAALAGITLLVYLAK
jgi:hypothetical protein